MERVLLREPTIVGFSKILDILLILYNNNNNNNHIKIYENTIMKKSLLRDIWISVKREKKKKKIVVEKHLRDKCTFVFILLFERTVKFLSDPDQMMYLYYPEFSRFILCVCLVCQSCTVCDGNSALADTFYSDFNCTWWWKSAEGQYRCLSCKSDVNGKKKKEEYDRALYATRIVDLRLAWDDW